MRDVSERQETTKARTTPLDPQSDIVMERCVKSVEEHLRNAVSAHHRDYDERLPIFLLGYST
jgi:hypothetical protein